MSFGFSFGVGLADGVTAGAAELGVTVDEQDRWA